MQYELFYIDETDLTEFVDTRKYSMNREDEIDTWTDANRKVHGLVVRQKVVGEITLLFTNITQYNDFVDVVNQSKTAEGKYPVGVHVNNSQTTDVIENFNAFIEFSTKVVYATETYDTVPTIFEVTCTITEE